MRVTLYEPAQALNGKAYAGWANPGDELFFPHVDSCCALVIIGDKAAVGGHMGAQLPNTAKPDYKSAGQYIWELVLANHRRLNSEDGPCTVITIGEGNWYQQAVIQTIWGAAEAQATLPLRITGKVCPKGADVLATMTRITVRPCGTNESHVFDIPEGHTEVRDIGEQAA